MVDLNPSIPLVIPNVNGLNNPIKREKFSGWIEKTVWEHNFFTRDTF